MNNKRAAVITVIIVVMLCLCIALIYCCYSYYCEIKAQEFKEKYEIPPSPYTMKDIQNSDAAYLLDPNFELTTGNLENVLQSYFSAPARLSYSIYSSEKFANMIDTEYVCDKLERNATFGNLFKDKMAVETKESACIMINLGSSYYFRNEIGEIYLCCYNGNTYITALGFPFLGKDLLIEEDLTKEIENTIEEAFPYSREVYHAG